MRRLLRELRRVLRVAGVEGEHCSGGETEAGVGVSASRTTSRPLPLSSLRDGSKTVQSS